MFIPNDQTREYYEIVSRNTEKTKGLSIRQIKETLGYTEKHHIIPRCAGGRDTKENIVYLTAGDHFKCHQLLTEMTSGQLCGKMWAALWRMMNKQSHTQKRDYIFTEIDYELARINFAAAHSERMSGVNNPFFNKKHNTKSLEKMSAIRKGKTYEEIYGSEHAADLRKRRSAEQLGIPKGKQAIVSCPYCKVSGGFGIMKRWHFENCKSYSTEADVV